MSNDDHPRASSPVPQPLHASNGGSQAPAPQPPQSFSQDRQVPQPTAHQPPRRTKLGRQVLAVLVTLVAVLVIGALAGILYGLSVRSTYIHVRHPDPTPEATAPQIEADPTPVGYQGTATTTTELSPAWSSGLATAWTLPTDPRFPRSTAHRRRNHPVRRRPRSGGQYGDDRDRLRHFRQRTGHPVDNDRPREGTGDSR